MEIPQEMIRAKPESNTEKARRDQISEPTGWSMVKDCPKSPRIARETHLVYLTCSGSRSP